MVFLEKILDLKLLNKMRLVGGFLKGKKIIKPPPKTHLAIAALDSDHAHPPPQPVSHYQLSHNETRIAGSDRVHHGVAPTTENPSTAQCEHRPFSKRACSSPRASSTGAPRTCRCVAAIGARVVRDLFGRWACTWSARCAGTSASPSAVMRGSSVDMTAMC